MAVHATRTVACLQSDSLTAGHVKRRGQRGWRPVVTWLATGGVALGMGALGVLHPTGTAAADGLDVSPPAIIDRDGTQGTFDRDGTVGDIVAAIDGVIDEDGFQTQVTSGQPPTREGIVASPQYHAGH